MALLQAIDDQLPVAALLGCFFHFRQANRRRLGSDGHIKKLKSDAKFAHSFNLFSALAFIPEHDVKLLFSLMIEENDFPRELKEFARTYFKPTWLESEDGTDPIFPLKRWNCYERWVAQCLQIILKVSYQCQE